MTEVRRATTAVEAIEALVGALSSDGSVSSGSPSDEARAKFVEAQAKLAELAPTAEKMRRKCEARGELDAVRERLRALLPGAPEEPVKAAQEAIDAGTEMDPSVDPLLNQALELEGVATYGAKTVERVAALLERFDAARQRLAGELAPKLLDAVEAAAAEDAAKAAEEARARAEREEEERKRAEEEARRAVVGLMAENEERLKAQKAKEEEEARLQAQEEAAKMQAEAALIAEEEALQREEKEGEERLATAGPEIACAEALAAMLASPVGAYREAVEALHATLGGIAAEPQDVRMRVIRAANEGFQKQLGRRPGVRLFLRGVGFDVRSRESLPSGLLANLGLSGGPPTERFYYMQEPNMMEAYEEWTVWLDRVKAAAEFLHGLERLAFQRTAHLGQHGLDVAAHSVISAGEVMQRWSARTGSS